MGAPSYDEYNPAWMRRLDDAQKAVSYEKPVSNQAQQMPVQKTVYGDYKPVEKSVTTEAMEVKAAKIAIDSPNFKVNIDDDGSIGVWLFGGITLGLIIAIVMWFKLGKGK